MDSLYQVGNLFETHLIVVLTAKHYSSVSRNLWNRLVLMEFYANHEDILFQTHARGFILTLFEVIHIK